MVRSTTRQYTSAQRTYQPSRSLTSAETTHTSNTYPPYPSPIRPGTGYQRTPPIPPRQSIPLPQPHPTSRPRARRRRQPGAHPGAQGQTANPPLPLSAAPSKRPSPPPKTTHPAPQGATTIPDQGRQMDRPQTHPCPRRTKPLPVRPHHPGGLGTLQEMPPPYRQGHASGLVPGGNPTTTRPTHSSAHQATEHFYRDPLVKEATMRGAVTQALH